MALETPQERKDRHVAEHRAHQERLQAHQVVGRTITFIGAMTSEGELEGVSLKLDDGRLLWVKASWCCQGELLVGMSGDGP